ncbi:MAG: IS66 family transposase [Trebonia sp.]
MTADSAVDDLAAVAGIVDVLGEMLAEKNEALAGARSENEQLTGQVSSLSGQVTALLERVAKLERQVSRNSGNSGMPPSGDDIPGRTPPAPKPERGSGGKKKRPGKQPGAPGSHLAWSDAPDDTLGLFPHGQCDCGRDLDDADDLGIVASHQIVDTPEAAASLVQYDEHEVRCRCGKRHAAPPPAGAGAEHTVSYGPQLQALVVFLLVMHHVPVERCAQILEALTGARPSDGFVHSLIARAAAAVRFANMVIRVLVITASVVSADETPVRVGPGPKTRKKYLLVACTNLLTYFFLGDRSMKSFNAFALPDMSGAVIVHDRYQNYDAIPGVQHQLCTQHLLRDLEDAAQTYPDAVWPGQAMEALRAMIHASNAARGSGLPSVPADGTAADLKLFRQAVIVGLSETARVPGASTRQKPGRCLLECLRDREADVLRFLSDTRIPPTSNQAERDLRPSKTQQKVSGRLRSEARTRDRYAARGYLDTARKHGIPVMAAIRAALAGDPWMPELPAFGA